MMALVQIVFDEYELAITFRYLVRSSRGRIFDCPETAYAYIDHEIITPDLEHDIHWIWDDDQRICRKYDLSYNPDMDPDRVETHIRLMEVRIFTAADLIQYDIDFESYETEADL